MRAFVLSALAVLALSACSNRERDITLHDLRGGNEPEEFSVAPNKPLQLPDNLKALPSPTPGQANRADQTPLADAVAALGGNPDRLTPGTGIPGGDQAIVARVSRFGREGGIRETLAAEDLEFRKRRSRFTWKLVPEDEYYRVYRRLALDPYRWLDVYRRAGARVPAAPPE